MLIKNIFIKIKESFKNKDKFIFDDNYLPHNYDDYNTENNPLIKIVKK